MSRKCKACSHKKRKEIDRDLVDSVPYRTITKKYDITRQSLIRHKDNHLPAELVKAKEVKEVIQAGDLLDRLVGLQLEARDILDKVKKSESYTTALAAIRELSRLMEIEAKVTGEIKEVAVQVNITQVVVDVGSWLEKKHNKIYREYKQELISKYETIRN